MYILIKILKVNKIKELYFLLIYNKKILIEMAGKMKNFNNKQFLIAAIGDEVLRLFS